jgi:hypothetical protein
MRNCPDTGKWRVRSPGRRVLRSERRDHGDYDGQEWPGMNGGMVSTIRRAFRQVLVVRNQRNPS